MAVKRTVLQDEDIPFQPGAEWHSKPIHLRAGDRLVVSATGTGRFYGGLFDRIRYHQLVGSDAGQFGFEFGSDRRGFTDSIKADEDEDFYVVFRVGIFAKQSTVHSRIELQRGE